MHPARPDVAALFLLSLAACGGPLDVVRADLEGAWQAPCYNKTQTKLTYKNLELTGTYTEYTDDACATPRHIATWTGHATGGEPVTDGIKKLDIAFTSFKSKALSDAEAAYVNMAHYCGFTDWAANVERDVLGRDCYNFSIPVGGVSLDIYQRAGATLLFGKGSKIGTGLTEADRPTEIDAQRVFSKAM